MCLFKDLYSSARIYGQKAIIRHSKVGYKNAHCKKKFSTTMATNRDLN